MFQKLQTSALIESLSSQVISSFWNVLETFWSQQTHCTYSASVWSYCSIKHGHESLMLQADARRSLEEHKQHLKVLFKRSNHGSGPIIWADGPHKWRDSMRLVQVWQMMKPVKWVTVWTRTTSALLLIAERFRRWNQSGLEGLYPRQKKYFSCH